MFSVLRSPLFVLMLMLVVLGHLFGCAGLRAVDTTKFAEYVTGGERQVTYTVIPGDLAGLPDKTLAIPTVPGKDVHFTAYYPDGQVQWDLQTQRSAVLDMLAASVSGIDAEKFAEDARQRAWLDSQRDFYMSMAQPFLNVAMQGLQSRVSGEQTQTVKPTAADQTVQVLQWLKSNGYLQAKNPTK